MRQQRKVEKKYVPQQRDQRGEKLAGAQGTKKGDMSSRNAGDLYSPLHSAIIRERNVPSEEAAQLCHRVLLARYALVGRSTRGSKRKRLLHQITFPDQHKHNPAHLNLTPSCCNPTMYCLLPYHKQPYGTPPTRGRNQAQPLRYPPQRPQSVRRNPAQPRPNQPLRYPQRDVNPTCSTQPNPSRIYWG